MKLTTEKIINLAEVELAKLDKILEVIRARPISNAAESKAWKQSLISFILLEKWKIADIFQIFLSEAELNECKKKVNECEEKNQDDRGIVVQAKLV